jgi:hypothetical protein
VWDRGGLFQRTARPPESLSAAVRVRMTRLSAFGLFAVSAMLVCYTFEDRSPWFILAFAAACACGSLYGFLQGAWPFGLVEAVWAIVALRKWFNAATSPGRHDR